MAADYLAISKLVYLTQLELYRTPGRWDLPSGALQRTFVGVPTDELGYLDLLPSVGSRVLRFCIWEGMLPDPAAREGW